MLDPQENLGSHNESESVLRSDSEAVLAPLVRQEELMEPKFSGVYDIAEFAKYRRHANTVFFLLYMPECCIFFSEVEEDINGEDDTLLDHYKQVTIDESSLPVTSTSEICNTDSLTKTIVWA